ncbi:hypothetical protein F5Y05DRAFT_387408 [Hypoxylon sp. FL0543]|nr:hypothetical protein F5Y05DRAFT_387408 [Hypoxylon sp. FL0543]
MRDLTKVSIFSIIWIVFVHVCHASHPLYLERSGRGDWVPDGSPGGVLPTGPSVLDANPTAPMRWTLAHSAFN